MARLKLIKRQTHISEDHHLKCKVFQLADIAWPGVSKQHFERATVQRRDCLIPSAGMFVQEVFHQSRDIVFSFPQGWQAKAYPVDPEIEFATKSSGFNFELQTSIRW